MIDDGERRRETTTGNDDGRDDDAANRHGVASSDNDGVLAKLLHHGRRVYRVTRTCAWAVCVEDVADIPFELVG